MTPGLYLEVVEYRLSISLEFNQYNEEGQRRDGCIYRHRQRIPYYVSLS
jgi:hypothetical protein